MTKDQRKNPSPNSLVEKATKQGAIELTEGELGKVAGGHKGEMPVEFLKLK